MDYEQTTLKDVVALRNQAQAAKATGTNRDVLLQKIKSLKLHRVLMWYLSDILI